jgi:hypothetical protein
VLFAILAAAEIHPWPYHQLDHHQDQKPQPQVLAAVHASAFLAFNGPATHAQITAADQMDLLENSPKLCKLWNVNARFFWYRICENYQLLIKNIYIASINFWVSFENCFCLFQKHRLWSAFYDTLKIR